jgi:hypothetical protein
VEYLSNTLSVNTVEYTLLPSILSDSSAVNDAIDVSLTFISTTNFQLLSAGKRIVSLSIRTMIEPVAL